MIKSSYTCVFIIASIVVSAAYSPETYNAPLDQYKEPYQYDIRPDLYSDYPSIPSYKESYNGIPCPLPKKIEVDVVYIDSIHVIAQNKGSYEVKIDLTIELTNNNARGGTFDQTVAAVSLPGGIPYLLVRLEPAEFQVGALTARRVKVSAFLSCPDELVPMILGVYEKRCVSHSGSDPGYTGSTSEDLHPGNSGSTLPLKIFIQAKETCEGAYRSYQLPGLTTVLPVACAKLGQYIAVLKGAPIISGFGDPASLPAHFYNTDAYEIKAAPRLLPSTRPNLGNLGLNLGILGPYLPPRFNMDSYDDNSNDDYSSSYRSPLDGGYSEYDNYEDDDYADKYIDDEYKQNNNDKEYMYNEQPKYETDVAYIEHSYDKYGSGSNNMDTFFNTDYQGSDHYDAYNSAYNSIKYDDYGKQIPSWKRTSFRRGVYGYLKSRSNGKYSHKGENYSPPRL